MQARLEKVHALPGAMRMLRALLPLLAWALLAPAAGAAPACTVVGPLSFCDFQGGTYKETSLVLDEPTVATAGVREVWFEGFVGTDTTYEAFAYTGRESALGENGARVGYRCLQFNGGPSCTLLVVGATATLAGVGGPTQFAGYQRDFGASGAWCLEGDLADQCVPGPFPLPPLPAL